LFPEQVRLRISPAEVLAGGRSIACDPAFGAEPWQGAVAALKTLEWTQACRVTVVLSNHFVRYAVLPWSDALAGAAEEEAYLRHHFAKIHGERAKSWALRASEGPRGKLRLASAIDTALLGELRSAFPKSGKAKLVSVQPELMSEFNARRAALPQSGAWLVLAEPGRACVALHTAGGWRAVQNAKGAWLDLLERERFRAHDSEQALPDLVLLSGAPPPEQAGGWRFLTP
jgi:hypothetical protein